LRVVYLQSASLQRTKGMGKIYSDAKYVQILLKKTPDDKPVIRRNCA